MGVLQTPLLHVQVLSKMDYNNDKSIHAPPYNYNEVMWLLELADIIERLISMLLQLSTYSLWQIMFNNIFGCTHVRFEFL